MLYLLLEVTVFFYGFLKLQIQKVPKPPIHQLPTGQALWLGLPWAGWLHWAGSVCTIFVSLLPSSPFFATAKHNHLLYRNQISHQQIPSDSFLTSQQPPASSSSSSLLPDASDITLSYPSYLKGFSPTPTFQNCHHEQQIFLGQVFQGGTEDWTTVKCLEKIIWILLLHQLWLLC